MRNAFAFCCLPVIFSVGAVARAFAVERAYAPLRDCHPCFLQHVLHEDLRIVGPCLILSVLLLAKSKVLRLGVGAVLVAFALAYFVDLSVFVTLHQRLVYASVPRFVHPHGWAAFLMAPRDFWDAVIFAAPVAVAICVLWHARHRSVPRAIGASSLITGLILTSYGFSSDRLIDPIAFQTHNFIELNHDKTSLVPYSDAMQARLLAEPQAPPPACQATTGPRRNVILLIVESLSSYQSRFFSGLSDFTPRLDALAREHTSYTNFHANSFASGFGRRALLLGSTVIQSPYRNELNENLYHLFKEKGYWTKSFFASRSFVEGFGSWMNMLGVDALSTSDDPVYEGAPRHVFGSISDRLLYENVLKDLDDKASARPYFLSIITASSHQPFKNPDTGKRGIKAAFAYADEQLGVFVAALRERHFFNNGMLLITGDHHAMNPISPQERQRFGAHASSMIPLIVIDSSAPHPKVVDLPFQQADLLHSLTDWLGACDGHTDDRGRLFNGVPPDCIFHTNGDIDDTVDVFCGKDAAVVLLDGDRTRVIEGRVADEERMLRQLHRERLSLERRVTSSSKPSAN